MTFLSDPSQTFMLLGFVVAAYSIVANDSIQTLGTFLSSNARRPWWVLWGFAASILSAVLIYGWATSSGDPAYGRLAQIPFPDTFHWWHLAPPVVLLLLTSRGIPVSTTFLVLSVFTPGMLLAKIVMKSLVGYAIAFGAALAIWYTFSSVLEKHFRRGADRTRRRWVALQWISTGFLWSQWLVQDFANIFVFLPRQLDFSQLVGSLVVILGLLALIIRARGGAIQKIVASKTNTTDIRSATVIDLAYGLILLYFKQLNNLPMSTTWVFLGLLAGREFAINHRMKRGRFKRVRFLTLRDFGKAAAGLAISVLIALSIKTLLLGESLASP